LGVTAQTHSIACLRKIARVGQNGPRFIYWQRFCFTIVMKKGDTVHWNWSNGEAEGKIVKQYTEPVTKTIKGTKVKRNASKDEPAYEIKQASGAKVLKLEGELKKGKK
jgi:hypothetical protein